MRARDGYTDDQVATVRVRFDESAMLRSGGEVIFNAPRPWDDGEEAVATISPTYFATDRARVPLQFRVLQCRDGEVIDGGHIYFAGGASDMEEAVARLALGGWLAT